MTTLHVGLGADSYDIYVEGGLLKRAGELFRLERKVLVVTDDGVPKAYAETLAAQCGEAHVVTLPQGEGSKTLETVGQLLRVMMAHHFTRGDCVAAVGGGVMGDLAGFTAATYMRGVDFYNVPTTVLSQVDSSVGGKTGVNLDHIKNLVGAFKQPKGVIIDRELLRSLPQRQLANGLSEAVKMALTFDEELFSLFEKADPEEALEAIIVRSLELKIDVVEQDVKEAGLRKVLNFGHTIGHAFEVAGNYEKWTHGQAVAVGMLWAARLGAALGVTPESVEDEIAALLTQFELPHHIPCPRDVMERAVCRDKKRGDGGIRVVLLESVGSARTEEMAMADLLARLEVLHERQVKV